MTVATEDTASMARGAKGARLGDGMVGTEERPFLMLEARAVLDRHLAGTAVR